MKAVIQRVTHSKVTVDDATVGSIDNGMLVLLGVGKNDSENDVDYLVNKIVHLRIFEDDNDKMNLSLKDVGGSILVVSQFTIMGECRKGLRPSFSNAANPELANTLYEYFINEARKQVDVQTGQFQAHMMVELCNDGPVTLIIESPKRD